MPTQTITIDNIKYNFSIEEIQEMIISSLGNLGEDVVTVVHADIGTQHLEDPFTEIPYLQGMTVTVVPKTKKLSEFIKQYNGIQGVQKEKVIKYVK